MNIAFWSPERHSGCVTSNLIAIAGLHAACHVGGRYALLENHFNMPGIGEYCMSSERRMMVAESPNNYDRYGLEGVLMQIYQGRYENITKASIDLVIPGLSYFTRNRIIQKDIFEFRLQNSMGNLYSFLDTNYNYTFTDLENASNHTTFRILERADLIVVNLSQRPGVIPEFINNYSNLLPKTYILISKYQYENNAWLVNIRRKYRIRKNKIGIVPYNRDYIDALYRGRALHFIESLIKKPDSRTNKYFINEVMKAANDICQHDVNVFDKQGLLI